MSEKICSRCVMDDSDQNLVLDVEGVCNHCRQRERWMAAIPASQPDREPLLQQQINVIQLEGRGRSYDCLLGVSGGVDSSYLACLCARWGLRPLIVHFDNGWNSELAVKNIEQLISTYRFDFQTYVMDWPEFRDLQRAFLRAGVIDIEMLTDQAITASIFQFARKYRIKTVLSGSNFATESHMPQSWLWMKYDAHNVRAIHRRFGELGRINRFPLMGIMRYSYVQTLGGFRFLPLLNYISYRKDRAIAEMEAQCGWTYYGGKHYESVFTRFYQAYILPEKFGVDKRRAHFSSLICNEEMTREQALEELQHSPYGDRRRLEQDYDYVLKKLGFSRKEFDGIMRQPRRDHLDYPSEYRLYSILRKMKHRLAGGQ